MSFLLKLLRRVVQALLHRALFSAQFLRLRLTRARLLLELLLLTRHLQHFLNGLVERLCQLRLPLVHLLLARLLHRVRRTVHLARSVARVLLAFAAFLAVFGLTALLTVLLFVALLAVLVLRLPALVLLVLSSG